MEKEKNCVNCKHRKYVRSTDLYYCRNKNSAYNGEHMKKDEYIDFCPDWEQEDNQAI